jgi:hypothetical protein
MGLIAIYVLLSLLVGFLLLALVAAITREWTVAKGSAISACIAFALLVVLSFVS